MLQIAHWIIFVNLLWVLWQRSSADKESEKEEGRERELEKTQELQKPKVRGAAKDEIKTATALMG